jgi:branched-subunit amino acid ABC-type transport system permease component
MIGAFLSFTVAKSFGGGSIGFWLALILAPLGVALLGFVLERGLFRHLYRREHLMLLLFCFALVLIFGDLVKLIWGVEYKSVSAPNILSGSLSVFGLPIPRYNLFLIIIGVLIGIGLWLLLNKTKFGKISRAAAVDMEMVGAVGINVKWIVCAIFVFGCFLAGLGGALIAPTVNVTLGMDETIIIETFLIVTMGGLGNMLGALVASLIFGLVHSLGVLVWPQFAIVFPYAIVAIVLILRPTGLLKPTVW